MAEAAASLMVFVMLVLGGMDLLRVWSLATRLQNASFYGARYASLGLGGANRVNQIKQQVVDRARALGASTRTEWISICPANDAECSSDNAGTGGQWIVVEIEQPLELISLAGASVTLRQRALIKNELFS